MERVYRAKKTNDGEWVEGGLVFSKHGTPHIVYFVTRDGIPCVDIIQVDPETVGQYVRDDCDGKRAFEGDIINNGFIIGVIRFGEYQKACNDDKFASHIGFYVEWSGGKSLHNILRKDVGFWLNRTSVIGNIHDNPELLKPAGDYADGGALAPAT